jgi:hypothetical protein
LKKGNLKTLTAAIGKLKAGVYLPSRKALAKREHRIEADLVEKEMAEAVKT